MPSLFRIACFRGLPGSSQGRPQLPALAEIPLRTPGTTLFQGTSYEKWRSPSAFYFKRKAYNHKQMNKALEVFFFYFQDEYLQSSCSENAFLGSVCGKEAPGLSSASTGRRSLHTAQSIQSLMPTQRKTLRSVSGSNCACNTKLISTTCR